MYEIQLGNQRITLEHIYMISVHENASRIMQRDYLNAIMQVKVEREVRTALNSIDVNNGEHQLNTWIVNGKGVYVGTWSKRLSKFLHKEHHIKLDPQIISVITERVMRTMAGTQDEMIVSFSKKAWKAGEFGEASSSCWFGSGSYAHCQKGILESEYGGAVKIYTPSMASRARCWYYNLENSLLLFNAYDKLGKLDILSIARLLSLNWNVDYMKHNEVIMDTAYINGKAVYAIGNPPIQRPVTLDFALRQKISIKNILDDDPVLVSRNNKSCPRCGSDRYDIVTLESGERACTGCSNACYKCSKRIVNALYTDRGRHVCESCSSILQRCDGCGYLMEGDECYNCNNDDTFYCDHCEENCGGEQYITAHGATICQGCRDEYYCRCSHCDELYHNDNVTYIEAYDNYACEDCLSNLYTMCNHCDEYIRNDDAHIIRDTPHCESCAEDLFIQCERCGEYEDRDDYYTIQMDDAQALQQDWCIACAESHSTECEDCGERYDNAVEHLHGEDDEP